MLQISDELINRSALDEFSRQRALEDVWTRVQQLRL